MTLGKLFKNIRPFVKPYKWLVVLTLTLTLVSSLAAQFNAVVLDRTVDSINVIKSFNRERVEGDKQLDLQNALTDNQMQTRKLSFIFDGLKTFVEQVGTVLIIILTAYLMLTDYPGMSIGKISRTMSS